MFMRVMCNDYLLASMIISGGIGFVLAPFNASSFVIVLGGFIIITLFLSRNNSQYDFAFKLAVILAYVFGWLLGKFLNECDVNFFSERHDKSHTEFVRNMKGRRFKV